MNGLRVARMAVGFVICFCAACSAGQLVGDQVHDAALLMDATPDSELTDDVAVAIDAEIASDDAEIASDLDIRGDTGQLACPIGYIGADCTGCADDYHKEGDGCVRDIAGEATRIAAIDFETQSWDEVRDWWKDSAGHFSGHYAVVDEKDMTAFSQMGCHSGSKCLRMNFDEEQTDPLTGKPSIHLPQCELIGPSHARIGDEDNDVTLVFHVRFDRVNDGGQVVGKLAYITVSETELCPSSIHAGYLGGNLATFTPCNSETCCSHNWTISHWGSTKNYFSNEVPLRGDGTWHEFGIHINYAGRYFQFYQNGVRLGVNPKYCENYDGVDCANGRLFWSLEDDPNGGLHNIRYRGLQIPYPGTANPNSALTDPHDFPEVLGGMMFDDFAIYRGNPYE